MLEKLRIKITILASLIVTACAYLYKVDFLRTCYTIILTIIIFYLLGGFIEIFLQKQFDKIKEIKKMEENIEEDIDENIDENIDPNSEFLEENLDLQEETNIS